VAIGIHIAQILAAPAELTAVRDSMNKTEHTIHIVGDCLFSTYSAHLVAIAPQDSDSESSGGQGHTSAHTYADYPSGAGQVRDAYPAWSADRQIPLSKEEIEDVFLDLTQKFGFQRDSMRNMVRNVTQTFLFIRSISHSLTF
jgi:hypothetical protein